MLLTRWSVKFGTFWAIFNSGNWPLQLDIILHTLAEMLHQRLQRPIQYQVCVTCTRHEQKPLIIYVVHQMTPSAP